jgi:hypothetical protein
MELLNSVLIEGTIREGPYKASPKSGECYFLLASEADGKPVEIRVSCIGELALSCFEKYNRGDTVRLVGKLVGHILAEHVEHR